MSMPHLLAETDAKLIQELNTLDYFKNISLTVIGNGFGDTNIFAGNDKADTVSDEVQNFHIAPFSMFVNF
jgi:hypothetical protein